MIYSKINDPRQGAGLTTWHRKKEIDQDTSDTGIGLNLEVLKQTTKDRKEFAIAIVNLHW